MGDGVDQLLDVFRRGKFAVTVAGTTLAHAFLPPGTRNPTLQVSSPAEIPRYHLRVFVDRGEVVFLVADQDAPEKTPARHPWAVRIPIADSLRALERELGEPALEGFKSRLAKSVYPAKIGGMKGVWVLVGMFDAQLPLDQASFDGDTTRMDESAIGSTLRRAKIVSGEEFCTMEREMGLVVEPDEHGNPVSLWMVYRPPPGTPEWVAAIAVQTRPAMIEMTRFAIATLETIRPVVQARTTGVALPVFPNVEEVVDDVLNTVRQHLFGMRTFGGLVYPWDAVDQRHS